MHATYFHGFADLFAQKSLRSALILKTCKEKIIGEI